MRKYFRLLSNEQIKFICREFDICRQALFSMTEKESCELYDKLGLIEADEIIESNEAPLSDRGEMASSIVTILGNALAKDEGWI